MFSRKDELQLESRLRIAATRRNASIPVVQLRMPQTFEVPSSNLGDCAGVKKFHNCRLLHKRLEMTGSSRSIPFQIIPNTVESLLYEDTSINVVY